MPVLEFTFVERSERISVDIPRKTKKDRNKSARSCRGGLPIKQKKSKEKARAPDEVPPDRRTLNPAYRGEEKSRRAPAIAERKRLGRTNENGKWISSRTMILLSQMGRKKQKAEEKEGVEEKQKWSGGDKQVNSSLVVAIRCEDKTSQDGLKTASYKSAGSKRVSQLDVEWVETNAARGGYETAAETGGETERREGGRETGRGRARLVEWIPERAENREDAENRATRRNSSQRR
ncbi:hypothetical protein C8R45DRAFT_942184 [Mycena sanguinolenta]|nr:hypothetical protein C8R45DRAFT_942184 [Mycena sanguinolenta]